MKQRKQLVQQNGCFGIGNFLINFPTHRSSGLLRSRLAQTLVPSYSALCRPTFIPASRLSQRFLLGGSCAALGFACIRFVSFKPFWPPALVQQALVTIVLAALRRFRGSVLFPGPRPSSIQCAPFGPSGLTRQSSGPAKGGPLTLVVSLIKECV